MKYINIFLIKKLSFKYKYLSPLFSNVNNISFNVEEMGMPCKFRLVLRTAGIPEIL